MKLKSLNLCPVKYKIKDESISYFQLFIFASLLDKFLLLTAIACAVITGCIPPYFLGMYGDITGSIISYHIHLNDSLTQQQIYIMDYGLRRDVKTFAIKIAGLSLVMIICTYISNVFFKWSSSSQIFKMRAKFLESILNQDIQWFDTNKAGSYTTIFTENISKIEEGIGEKIEILLYYLSSLICGIVFLLIRGWKLALVSTVSILLTTTLLGMLSSLSSTYNQELDLYGAAGSVAEEVLGAIKTVVAFGGQEKEIDRYNQHLHMAKANNIRKSIFISIANGCIYFFMYSNYALCFWYGVKLIIEEIHVPSNEAVYTPGNMIAIFSIAISICNNFGVIIPMLEVFSTAVGAGQEVFFVINNKPKINKHKHIGLQPSGFFSSIKFENIYFAYPSRPDVMILEDFNLKINYGETVALVGSSGCGKSTCLQLIQRFYDPVKGNIYIDSNNLKEINLLWLKEKIGVVGQEPVLFGTTISENIRYGKLNATQMEIEEAAKISRVHDFILSLPKAYETIIGEGGSQLSGGQKQRIAIARALVKKPEILLLDEATSALDTTSEAEIQAALDSISGNCTTIIVAHRLSTIRNANTIIFIDKGRVIEKGSHEELMEAQGDYYKMVLSQNITERIDPPFEKTESGKILSSTKIFEINAHPEISKTEDMEKYTKIKSYFLNLIELSRPEWFYIILGCISSAVTGAFAPVCGIIYGDSLGDLAFTNTNKLRQETNLNCVYFVLIGIIGAITGFLQVFSFSVAAEGLTQRMRQKSFKAMLYQELGWFENTNNGVGNLCAQLAEDATDLQGVTGAQIGICFSFLSTAIVTCTLSLCYEWKVALLSLCFSPFILLSIYIEQKSIQNDSKGNHSVLKKSAKIAVEAISNIRTVSSLACEEEFQKLYVADLKRSNKSTKINLHFRAVIIGMSRILLWFSYVAGLSYGVTLIISKEVYYGTILKVLEVVLFGSYSLGNALALSQNLQKGILAAGRILSLLERVPEIRNDAQPLPTIWQNENVAYSQIYFSYPNRPTVSVLKHLNMSIMKGKTVALVGSSGCGKSTIIQLLERFYDPNHGSVKVEDRDIKLMELQTLRSQLGIVFQEPSLFDRTIAENIAYGVNHREVTMNEIVEAAKSSNIHSFITSLPMGYETRIGIKGTQLSGGQKQRIAIARALLRNPKILLLDEATSALDNESEKIVQEALDKAKVNRTCIIIAHRLATIQDADVICVLKEGRVAEIGKHLELLKRKGLYYNFYKMQCG